VTVSNRKLGRRPPKDAPALRLRAFLTGIVPAHPTTVDHFGQVKRWFLGRNNEFGTCGPTSDANYIKLVFRYLLGEDVTVTDDAILDLYRRSGNPHFNPATGEDDNGVIMQTMLEAMLAGGIEVVRADGTRETVKPVAFAQVDVANLDEVRAAVAIFGGVLFGVDLEVAQQAQTDAQPPLWDYQHSGEWGGHAILAGLYTSASSSSDISVVTWAEVVGTTDAFCREQLEEAWVVVLPQHLANPAFQQGIDLAALRMAYQQLTGRPLPIPAPVLDPDHVFADALKKWMAHPRLFGSATLKRAGGEWLKAKGL
jgi:hypothetical protein